ncbi:MAG: ABC transporter ATP-binding protein [Nitrospirae bacterium]|nr:ABC transporter ATP-binding protein [Nitrospirota bacterium]MBF0539848.1 ABC transporter ATP-binding protein [Nitrospirota bacterium]
MIEVDSLIVDYPGHRAIKNISFNIKAGTVTSIVGPNGAGKTTLLMCLAALMRPLSGTIKINGIDTVKDPRKCHRNVGYLPDFFGLYDAMTVEQYIKYFAFARGITSDNIDGIVKDTAEKLNLINKFDQNISTLSRGMRQRLAIAQAIIHTPRVLLLDEPSSGLDPDARHSLSNLLKELNKKGATILVSSHILAELQDYSTDVIILRKGEIVEKKVLHQFNPEKRRIIIKTTTTVDNISSYLPQSANIAVAKIKDNIITIDFTGTEQDQYELLKDLINRDLNICEYTVEKSTLQDEYLKHTKSKDKPINEDIRQTA